MCDRQRWCRSRCDSRGGGGGGVGRGLRPAITGDEIAEGSATDGSITAAAEKRGLYNLRVPAPTTPEMIRKEKRQDNDVLEYVLVTTVRTQIIDVSD